MKVIQLDRALGKTTIAIDLAIRKNLCLVCHTKATALNVKRLIRSEMFPHSRTLDDLTEEERKQLPPIPLSAQEFINGIHRGRLDLRSSNGFIIDDVDFLLNSLAGQYGRSSVEFITITNHED